MTQYSVYYDLYGGVSPIGMFRMTTKQLQPSLLHPLQSAVQPKQNASQTSQPIQPNRPSPLSNLQKETIAKFSSLSVNDYIKIDQNGNVGDVFERLLSMIENLGVSTASDDAVPSIPLSGASTDGAENVQDKYKEKLLQAAKRTEEMLKAKDEERQKKSAPEPKSADPKSPAPDQKPKTPIKKKDTDRNSNLPSHVKPLSEIMNLDLLKDKTSDEISNIWTTHHQSRAVLSASLTSQFYTALTKKSSLYPMFVLPLTRPDGYEMYLLQFQGHQIFFVPLLTYKTHTESAPPSLVLTFHTDLQKEKDVVLMEGVVDGLGLAEAQELVFGVQRAYVVGTESQMMLVERFWKEADAFKHEDLIEAFKL